MKKLLFILCLVSCYIGSTHAQQDFVVQSVHAQGASKSLLDDNRDLLITYGYQDQTIKFWNEKTGLLLKTIDSQDYVSDMVLNAIDGKLYVLSSNTIIIYNIDTFKEISKHPLGRIYDIELFEADGYRSLALFAQDDNGKQGMYALNEATGEFIVGNTPVFPGDGEVSYFQFSKDNTRVLVQSNVMENYVFSFDTNQYYEVKGYVLALLDNGDVIMGEYDGQAGKAVYIRQDPVTLKQIWKQEVKIEGVDGVFLPYKGDVTVNSDGQSIWVAPGTSLFVELDVKLGFILGKIYREEQKTSLMASGNFLYAQSGIDKPFAKFKRYENKPIQEYGYNVLEPQQIVTYFGENEIEILFAANYGAHTFSLLASPNVSRLTKYKTNYRDDYSDGMFQVDQNSNKVFSITKTSDPIKVFERGNAESFSDLITNIKDIKFFDYNPNSKLLATIASNGLRIIDTEKRTEVFSKIIGKDLPFIDRALDMAPNSNAILYATDEVGAAKDVRDRLQYFDFASGQEKWAKNGRYSALYHIKNGQQILVANNTSGNMEILDPETGNVLRSFPLNFNGSVLESALAPDEKHIIFSGYNTDVFVFEIASGRLVNSFTNKDFQYSPGTFVSNTVVSVSESGAIKFYDILTSKEVLRMYLFQDGGWITYTPEGYFEGSPSAWDKVAFVNNKQAIPLESVFDTFYTPRLMHKVLFDKSVIKRDDIKNLKSPPTVKINYKEGSRNLAVEDDIADTTITTQNASGEILLTANANGDRIAEFRLFQNGKSVGTNTRNLVVEDDVEVSGTEKTFKVNLVEGTNEFVGIAINSQGTESRPEKLTVIYKPAKTTPRPQGIQAHVLIVGIDTYKNPKYNLNYAVADATSFSESLQNGVKNITSKVNLYQIKNDQAVRENIIATFSEIASTANPQDIFVFYYAGHGVVSEDDDKDFYLVPYDVTQLYGNDGALKQKGVSAKELKRIASGIPAQKQLYILDACQSAGALTTIATRGAAEEKAIAQLARSTGTHWLTASGSEQYATEFDELGHGVFTYALLEALSGKADSGDNRITVNEIKAYIESRVPEISAQYKGSPQYPSSFGFGQDFPVGIKN